MTGDPNADMGCRTLSSTGCPCSYHPLLCSYTALMLIVNGKRINGFNKVQVGTDKVRVVFCSAMNCCMAKAVLNEKFGRHS